MRLEVLEHAEKFRARFLFRIIGFVMRKDPPIDVLKTIYHKQGYFGDPFLEIVNATLRGPSDWTVAERELFATFTSKYNECPFCVGSHAAIVELAPGGLAKPAVALDDWQNAPVDAKVKATLALLDKVNRNPSGLTAADFDAVRAAGVRDGAIEDALHIAFAFHIINRLANAFNFHVASPETFSKVGARLLKNGYRL